MSWSPEYRALVVEPHSATARLLSEQLKYAGLSAVQWSGNQEGLQRLPREAFGLAILNASVDARVRHAVVADLRQLGPVVVILLAAADELDTLDTSDADHVLARPLDLQHLAVALRIALRPLAERWQAQAWREQLDHFERHFSMPSPGWCAINPLSARVARTIPVAADSDTPVFIHGEVGAGKEFIARLIHQRSHRAHGAFVRFDPTTMPEDTASRLLLGNEGGSGPGVLGSRPLLELARGGTLYISELGAMGTHLQLTLLELLQSAAQAPASGRWNCRILAATSMNPADLQQRLRPDLYWLLHAFPIYVPSLAERPEDLPALIESFVSDLCRRRAMEPLAIERDSLERLLHWTWPGNVRELRNVLEYAIRLSDGSRIRSVDLPTYIKPGDIAARSAPAATPLSTATPGKTPELARLKVLDALDRAGGNRSHAAQILGISRVALWKRMRKLDLQYPVASAIADSGE
jgi:DNA-binding NtrC family response regulator